MIYTQFKVHLSLDMPPFTKVNFFERWDTSGTGEVLATGFFFNDPATIPTGVGPFATLQEAANAYLLMLHQAKESAKQGKAIVIRVDFKNKCRLDNPILNSSIRHSSSGGDYA